MGPNYKEEVVFYAISKPTNSAARTAEPRAYGSGSAVLLLSKKRVYLRVSVMNPNRIFRSVTSCTCCSCKPIFLAQLPSIEIELVGVLEVSCNSTGLFGAKSIPSAFKLDRSAVKFVL